jgi:hypothetical protein
MSLYFPQPEDIDTIIGLLQYINADLTNHLYGISGLVAVFAISFMYMKGRSTTSNVFAASSFITAILGWWMYTLKLLPQQAMYGAALLAGLSLTYLVMVKKRY